MLNKSDNPYTLFITTTLYYYLLLTKFTVFISHTFYIFDFIALLRCFVGCITMFSGNHLMLNLIIENELT